MVDRLRPDWELDKFDLDIDDKPIVRTLDGKTLNSMYGFIAIEATADGRAFNASFIEENPISGFQTIHFFQDGVEVFAFILGINSDKNLGNMKIEPTDLITQIIFAQNTNLGLEPVGTTVGALFSVGGKNVVFSILQDLSGFFVISDNLVQTLVEVPEGSYQLVVQAIGLNTQYTSIITIEIIATAPISNVNISNLKIEENSPIGTVVGSLSVVGGEEPITYTILQQKDSGGNIVDVLEVIGNVMQTKALVGAIGETYEVTGSAQDSRVELDPFLGTFIFEVVASFYVNSFSLTYNGIDEYINCGSDASLWGGQKFSFAAWIKPNNIGVSQYVASQFREAGKRSWGLRVNAAGTIAVIYSQTGVATDTTTSLDSVIFGAWQLVTFSFDGTLPQPKMKLWINDVLSIDEDTALTSLFLNIVPMLIGALGDVAVTASSFFDGLIDEVSIYSNALIQSSVEEIYNAGVPANLEAMTSGADLISWWRQGENFTGTVDPDEIGVNDGASVNMTPANRSTDLPS